MRKLRYITYLLTALILAACADDDGSGAGRKVYRTIVTFEGNEERQAVFSYQEVDDSPQVTLRINGRINTDALNSLGRVLLTYYLPEGAKPGESCTVDVIGVSNIFAAKVIDGPVPNDFEAPTNRISVTTLYRSGSYLNMQMQVPLQGGRKFAITVDETTLANPLPDLYITTTAETDTPTYDYRTYASFDISEIWESAQYQGVIVHVKNSNNTYRQTFEFKK